MQTRGAIIRQAPGKYEVVDLEVDDPRENEIQVQMVASGMCHSDDHVATGDIPVNVYPFAGGHEGAGIVTKAGVNTKGLEEGDHVVFSFLPSCGHCRWCASGMQILCELGSTLLDGARWGSPGDYRVKLHPMPHTEVDRHATVDLGAGGGVADRKLAGGADTHQEDGAARGCSQRPRPHRGRPGDDADPL